MRVVMPTIPAPRRGEGKELKKDQQVRRDVLDEAGADGVGRDAGQDGDDRLRPEESPGEKRIERFRER